MLQGGDHGVAAAEACQLERLRPVSLVGLDGGGARVAGSVGVVAGEGSGGGKLMEPSGEDWW